MKQTVLLTKILNNAEAIKNECNATELSASHIAVAFADFCAAKYIGFSISDTTIYPHWYEEERLRLLYEQVLKNISYFRLRLKKSAREGAAEAPFDFSSCEKFAALRGHDTLSADLVLLCVLKELMEQCKPVYRVAVSEETIIPLLEYVDANILDYTAKKVEAVCDELMKKAATAAAKRDWKPAEKFAEPTTLSTLFFEKIEMQRSDKICTLRFPKFFGTADLRVSIHQVDGVYYMHDNGCVIRHLARRLQDPQKLERALKKVCHPCWMDKGRITGNFVAVSSFLYYLQRLVFIAHADLYYPKAEKPLYYKDKSYIYQDAGKADAMDEALLLKELQNGIHFEYDENQGLYCWLDTRYSLFSGKASFLIETLEKGQIRISDRKKGLVEGEIFEAFYWDNDDLRPYHKFIAKIADRFGAEFDGKNLYLTDKNERFAAAIFKFFNLAVLLSEFGHDIALPKARKRVKRDA